MGRIIAGIIFLALAIYIVAVAVENIEQEKATAHENGLKTTSVTAKVNVDIVRYSGYVIGALGLILIAAGITRKMSPS